MKLFITSEDSGFFKGRGEGGRVAAEDKVFCGA